MKSFNLIPVLLVFAAGMSVPLAVLLNTFLGRSLKSPMMSALIVPTIGALFILLIFFATRNALPTYEDLTQVPWFLWTGGLLIAGYMLILIFNSAKLGMGFSTSLVVAGQLVMGVLLDHVGFLGLPQTSFSFGRLAGILTVMIGVALLKIF